MMPGRKPNTAGRICALGVCLVAVAVSPAARAGGCRESTQPASGVFIWPNETPYGGVADRPSRARVPHFPPCRPAGWPLTTPIGSPPAQTIPVRRRRPIRRLRRRQRHAPPVWPDPQAAAVYPNGFTWPASPAASGQRRQLRCRFVRRGRFLVSAWPSAAGGGHRSVDGPRSWCPPFGGSRSARTTCTPPRLRGLPAWRSRRCRAGRTNRLVAAPAARAGGKRRRPSCRHLHRRGPSYFESEDRMATRQ